jgi:benzylsuccinate CoA-transferase BbsF subunit
LESAFRDLRVLDYCWVGAGAFVTKFLADHGADVIKIESRARPDNLRLAPPYRRGAEGLEGSGYFASRNTSKRSFALNMSHPEAPAIARELAAHASLVTSNFRPGVMERWQMDYESLRVRNPSLIFLSMPMQGSDGPHRSFIGFGSTIAALTGLVALSGRPDRAPVGTGTHYPDHVPNPGHALVALLGALYRRQRTGAGETIELSQFESTINIVGPAAVAASSGTRLTRQGNRVYDASPHNVFQCAGDDRWCAISVRSDEEWIACCGVLGRAELAADARFASADARKAHEDELEAELCQLTRGRDSSELAEALQRAGVAASAVETPADVLADEQLVARDYWKRLDHPVMGSIVSSRAPFRASTVDSGPRHAAPLLGEHTREIATELLGLSDAEIDELIERQVFY